MFGISPKYIPDIKILLGKLRKLRHQNTWGALVPLRFLLSPADFKRFEKHITGDGRHDEYVKGYTWVMFEGIGVLEAAWVENGVPVACVIYRGELERQGNWDYV